MDKREFKNSVYNEIASLTKALSNPHRIEILDLLANGEKTVEQIAKETGLTFANASQHLQNLKKMRLVKIRRDKNYIYYELGNPYVYTIWKAFREFSRYHIPEINRTMTDFHISRAIDSVSYNDIENYEPYTLVDVRPASEYHIHHIPEAVNIPLNEIQSKISHLDTNNTIIVYCRGPFCALAVDAVDTLQKNGFRSLRLEESALDIKL